MKEEPSQGAILRAKAAFESNRFCAALWWACEALRQNPDQEDAKRVFASAFASASLSLVAVVGENKRIMPHVTKLMERSHLSQEEAEFASDGMISVYFAENLHNQIHGLLDRFNTDDAFRTATNLAQGDLDSAKLMAAALAELPSPTGVPDTAWRFSARFGQSLLSDMVFALQVDRKALVIVLRASTAREWARTCQSLYGLFLEAAKGDGLSEESIEDYRRRAEAHKPSADDVEIDDDLFRRYKNGFETAFAKNAAHIKWLLSIAREPE